MKPQFDETLLQDLDSFIKYYEFIDVEKIYTNGSELIQVSRIKQWFDYNNKQLESKLSKCRRKKEQVENACSNYKYRINKAIEYIGNGNLGIPRKTREKFIKILKGGE